VIPYYIQAYKDFGKKDLYSKKKDLKKL